MRILKVFPKRTSFTPRGDDVFIGDPPQLPPPPDCDEVHISVTFTWDIPRAEEMKLAWGQYYSKVLLDGPAYNNTGDCFIPGVYVKKGVVFTSRGCNNRCPWCHVPMREGNIRELPVMSGNILQDNNLLQCNTSHVDEVFQMLSSQRQVVLSGGLQAVYF